MRKYLFFPLCITVPLLLLFGCGGDVSTISPSSSSGASSSASSSEPVAINWDMVWSDEFNTSIDSDHWSFEVNCWGGGNNERQCYTDRAENAHVTDGVLHIVALEEDFSGPALGDDEPNYDPNDTSVTLPYTSARLRSKNLFDFKYGRIEIRAQLPGGQGIWPALWMLPTDWVYGGWPSSGEIDIMEAVNLTVEGVDNEVHGTLHYGLPWPQWSPWGGAVTVAEDLTTNFHTFALEWEADEIRWFVDGIHYQTQNSAGWYNYVWQGQEEGFAVSNPRAPFDENFHLIMNLAVGGDWPGAPDTNWNGNRELLVDYVRVYQCSAMSADGTGCASATDPVDAAIAVNAEAGEPLVTAFSIFADGPATFSFDVDGLAVENALVANVWEETPGNVVTTLADVGGDYGNVWDITFTGLGNVSLASGDMSGVEGIADGFALAGNTGWTNVGEIKFDLYVVSIDPATTLVVKLDSGYPNLGQVAIETPAVGEWVQVSVSISSLLANPEPSGTGLDIANIVNLFVLEPAGTNIAQIWIDNIRVQCAVNANALSWQQDQTCGVNPLTVAQSTNSPFMSEIGFYTDAVNTEIWDLGYQEFSTAGDHINQSEVELDAGNKVLDLEFLADGADGVAWIGATSGINLVDFSAGSLKLDVKVLDWASNTSGLMIKLECPGASCTTGDVSIGTEAVLGTNVWNSIEIPVADLVSNPGGSLDLSNVANFVFFPAWGDSQGVHFQIDNVRLEMGSLSIFEEVIGRWDIGVCCGGVAAQVIPDPNDASHGNVVEFVYSTDTTVTFFQASSPADLTAWTGGTIEFDLYVEAAPENANWMMKVDCEFPCGTGDVPLTDSLEGEAPTLGAWQHYTFNLDDLVALGLELSHIDTPLVIFPAWGLQNGAIFRVDNIVFNKAD